MEFQFKVFFLNQKAPIVFKFKNSNFQNFCLVIRTQPISVLKSFLLQYPIFFRTFGDYTATLTDGDAVDLYIGWVWDNNAFGTTGIAYLGTVCDGAKYRTSLNEYFMTDLQTAQVK